jgi:hypothetical protein
MFEKWPMVNKLLAQNRISGEGMHLPFDADLARANILLEIVAEVQVSGGLREISNVDHLVCVVCSGACSES